MRKFVPLVACCALGWSCVWGQDATRITLTPIQGEGAANRPGERALQNPVVWVLDQDSQPVSGAGVVFTLPTGGPSGVFEDGSKTLTVISDAKGVAEARGMKLNELTGEMRILVNVAHNGMTASAVITEFTVAPNGPPKPKAKHSKLILILAVVGGGAAAGAVVAMRGSGSGNNAPPAATITLGVGGSSVGAPR